MNTLQEIKKAKSIKIIMIAAVGLDNIIGDSKDNIPWHCPEDLNRFKETTKGHTVILGGKTHRSIGRSLPGRKNLVITRSSSCFDGALPVSSPKEALQNCSEGSTVYICGGGEIYRIFMPLADELTISFMDFAGQDTRQAATFPYISLLEWKQVREEVCSTTNEQLKHFNIVNFVRRC